jgi:hypothetical protein
MTVALALLAFRTPRAIRGLGTVDAVRASAQAQPFLVAPLHGVAVAGVLVAGIDVPVWFPLQDVERMEPAPPEVKPVAEHVPASDPPAPPRRGSPKKPAAQ